MALKFLLILIILGFYFSVAQVKHFQTVRERSDPEFMVSEAE